MENLQLQNSGVSIQPAGKDNVCLTKTLGQFLSAPGVQLYSSPCALTSLHCGASEKKIPLWGSVKYHIIVSVHLGMSGGSKAQSFLLIHRERSPVWQEALRGLPRFAPPAVAGGVWQHAAGAREVSALFRSWRDNVGEHRWSQKSSNGGLNQWSKLKWRHTLSSLCNNNKHMN